MTSIYKTVLLDRGNISINSNLSDICDEMDNIITFFGWYNPEHQLKNEICEYSELTVFFVQHLDRQSPQRILSIVKVISNKI